MYPKCLDWVLEYNLGKADVMPTLLEFMVLLYTIQFVIMHCFFPPVVSICSYLKNVLEEGLQ
jgi:hypothetical protein